MVAGGPEVPLALPTEHRITREKQIAGAGWATREALRLAPQCMQRITSAKSVKGPRLRVLRKGVRATPPSFTPQGSAAEQGGRHSDIRVDGEMRESETLVPLHEAGTAI